MRTKLTLEQLAAFIAVAERQHLTRAAEALHLTPSAVSAAIRKLEDVHGVALFHRPGRGIALTAEGHEFLAEARAVLQRARAAEQSLADLAGVLRGRVAVYASQTIASYWLPPVLIAFHRLHPGVRLELTIGNTTTVAEAVAEGRADIGFVEGDVPIGPLQQTVLVEDALQLVVGTGHPFAAMAGVTPDNLVSGTRWVLREAGSGTRSAFEQALAAYDIAPDQLDVVIELPSNEAVLAAARSGDCATVVSAHVAKPHIAAGDLLAVSFALPTRAFTLLVHPERKPGRAAAALARFSQEVPRA